MVFTSGLLCITGACVQSPRGAVQRGAGRSQRPDRDEQLLQATSSAARQEAQVCYQHVQFYSVLHGYQPLQRTKND